MYYIAATRLSTIPAPRYIPVEENGSLIVAWIIEHQERGGGKHIEAVGWEERCEMLSSGQDIGITIMNSEKLQSLHTSHRRSS